MSRLHLAIPHPGEGPHPWKRPCSAWPRHTGRWKEDHIGFTSASGDTAPSHHCSLILAQTKVPATANEARNCRWAWRGIVNNLPAGQALSAEGLQW